MILYAAVCGYVIASLILFRYPTLLHRKKKLKFRCHHISHRGGMFIRNDFLGQDVLYFLFTFNIYFPWNENDVPSS